MDKKIKTRETTGAFEELERGVYAALETYANVHRGSGHFSMVSTYLYEQARNIVLEFLGLDNRQYVVIFCTPGRAEMLKAQLGAGSYQCLSSQDFGLPLGVRALAIWRKALPGCIPFQTGGGTARLVSPGWVIWAHAPDLFEAGTPAIINVIAFARALLLAGHPGNDIFRENRMEKMTAGEILRHDEWEDYSGRKLLNQLRETLIGRGVLVPTLEGARRFVNLDYAASTPTFMPVWDTVRRTWRQPLPVQQEIIHEVQSVCAEMLGAPLADYNVLFTTNTTDAINLVAESLGNEPDQEETVVLNTLLEHTSNDLPWRMVPRSSLIRLGVDEDGFWDLNELDTILCAYNQKSQFGKKRIKLVAVSGASNVLGVFNNLEEISRVVHQYGACLLVDAAQLVAHRKVAVARCGIDYLAFSAHKVYAPFGTGVLVARKGLLHFDPARLERIRSSGEENVIGIAALGKALILLQRIGTEKVQEEEQALTVLALRGMAQIEKLRIYGIKDPDSSGFDRKGGVIVFDLKNMMPNQIARKLAEQGGIGVRYGCHCAHLLVKHILHVPRALAQFQGLLVTLFPGLTLPGVARVSLGIGSSEEDINTLIRVLDIIARRPGTPAPARTRKNVQHEIDEFVKAAALRVYA